MPDFVARSAGAITSDKYKGIDNAVSMRSWSGQHARVAAEEMGIPYWLFLARRRRMEVPALAQELMTSAFDQEVAVRNILRYGFKLQECMAYRQRGTSFFFWRAGGDERFFCHAARSNAWFHRVQQRAETNVESEAAIDVG